MCLLFDPLISFLETSPKEIIMQWCKGQLRGSSWKCQIATRRDLEKLLMIYPKMGYDEDITSCITGKYFISPDRTYGIWTIFRKADYKTACFSPSHFHSLFTFYTAFAAYEAATVCQALFQVLNTKQRFKETKGTDLRQLSTFQCV